MRCPLYVALLWGAYSHGLRAEIIPTSASPLAFKSDPTVIPVVVAPAGVDVATITDVEAADFDGDGRTDIAVAWYYTDYQDNTVNRRRLTLFRNTGSSLVWRAEFDLFIRDPLIYDLSVFRNGTADIGVGDFDGDGDLDIVVTPFFGDEIWFFENRGGWNMAGFVKYPFGSNTPGNSITPPEVLCADFNGDGRDDVAYIADPIVYIDGKIIHFWRTYNTVANMTRASWEGGAGGVFTQWTRGLAVADFDLDGRPDLCYTGATIPPNEEGPIFTVWYGLNVQTGRFSVLNKYPSFICSDVADHTREWGCPPGVMLTDRNGDAVQYWAPLCEPGGPLDFQFLGSASGYAGLSPNRGMAAAAADLDGDGDFDLVTKQKLGGVEASNQIELTLFSDLPPTWTPVLPTPINSTGFRNESSNQILRPRNLAVADLFGNSLPEIIAGFGLIPAQQGNSAGQLVIAVWQNGCVGDANRDGRTTQDDLNFIIEAMRTCTGDPGFSRDADLDKSGCIDTDDLLIAQADLGCRCCGVPGDLNCDGVVSAADIGPFMLAIANPGAYAIAHPDCNLLLADINGDGIVTPADIAPFVALLLQ